jgi:tetratricopeptide (TPR) repeat protein
MAYEGPYSKRGCDKLSTMNERRSIAAVFYGLTAMSALATPSAGQAQELSRDERDELARVHFRAGSRYFDLHRYAEAAHEFEQVFELTGQRPLLYNAARSWEAAGNARNAVRAYRQFLDGDTAGIDRSRVEAQISALADRARQEEQAAAQRAAAGCPEPAAAPMNSSTPTNSSTPMNSSAPTRAETSASAASLLQLQTRVTYQHRPLDAAAPWVLLGIGTVFSSLSIWQATAYATDVAAVQSPGPWTVQRSLAQGSAQDESRNAITAGATGGLFLLTGGLWLALRGRGERHEEVLRTAWIAPTLNGAVAGGRF